MSFILLFSLKTYFLIIFLDIFSSVLDCLLLFWTINFSFLLLAQFCTGICQSNHKRNIIGWLFISWSPDSSKKKYYWLACPFQDHMTFQFQCHQHACFAHFFMFIKKSILVTKCTFQGAHSKPFQFCPRCWTNTIS